MPNHPSVIARPTPTGFAGRYVHNDGHPDTRLPLLQALYTGPFARDVDAMQRYLIDEHPAGWSQLGPDPAVGTGWVNGRSGVGYGYGVCYCHGDRSDAEQLCTEATTQVGFVDCVYVLTVDGVEVWTDFGEDDVAVWRVATSVPWPVKLAPNPFSPHATADPALRHILPSPAFFPDPLPGVLAHTACDRLAVVPAENLAEAKPGADDLPDGLCPLCVAAMNGERPPERPVTDCVDCEARTRHYGLCVLCRQERHDGWWAKNGQQQAAEQ